MPYGRRSTCWRAIERWIFRSWPTKPFGICFVSTAAPPISAQRFGKGRKQYRYHPRFREVRESTKYEHVVAFAEALPTIRAKVREHMALRGLPREKVLATVVHLLH